MTIFVTRCGQFWKTQKNLKVNTNQHNCITNVSSFEIKLLKVRFKLLLFKNLSFLFEPVEDLKQNMVKEYLSIVV